MRNSCFPDLSVGNLVSGLSLSSMTPHKAHTTPSSPTTPSPSRSEKLLRDALLRDERERQHRSSPPLVIEAPTHTRRHTLSPTSSFFVSTKEEFTCASPLHSATSIPSRHKTSTAMDDTPSRIPVRIQPHRKKEGGLELRMPTHGRRSLGSTESFSSGTSGSSVSHFHMGYTSEFGASQSSLDVVSEPPQSPPPHFSVGHHRVQQSAPNSPSPCTKHFNARKASTQCRAIEGYVSFASVEGLGEPPLVGEEFETDGLGKGKHEDERIGGVAFLPLGVLNAALRWKKFVGGTGPGVNHGVEAKDQGVVV